MKMKQWWDAAQPAEQHRVAFKCGTTRVYLYQLAHSIRQPSPQLAIRIEGATAGKITRESLRPDIFGRTPRRPVEA